jgi:hypothetical protein
MVIPCDVPAPTRLVGQQAQAASPVDTVGRVGFVDANGPGCATKEGTAVSRSDLRPGDLVFFYSDLHHVGIYVGNGLMVHASRSGVPVKMARIDRGVPYMGARRPS